MTNNIDRIISPLTFADMMTSLVAEVAYHLSLPSDSLWPSKKRGKLTYMPKGVSSFTVTMYGRVQALRAGPSICANDRRQLAIVGRTGPSLGGSGPMRSFTDGSHSRLHAQARAGHSSHSEVCGIRIARPTNTNAARLRLSNDKDHDNSEDMVAISKL